MYIDLLTMQDLLLLKASKGGGSTDVKAIPPSKTNNKRYLILTHVGEFDQVHYPLNLCFDVGVGLRLGQPSSSYYAENNIPAIS